MKLRLFSVYNDCYVAFFKVCDVLRIQQFGYIMFDKLTTCM